MIPASKAILELVDEGLKFHHVVVKGNADSNIEAMVRLKIDSLPAAVAAAVAAAPTATEVNPVADPNADPAAASAAAAAVPTAAGGPAEVEETTMAEGSCEEMEAAAVMASVSNGAAPVVAAAAGTAGAAGAAAAPGGAGASQDVVVASAPVQEADAPGEVAGNVGEAAVFKVVDFRVGVTRIDGAPVSKDNKVAKNFIRVNGFDQVSNDIYKIKMKMCDSTNKNFAVYRITATVTDGKDSYEVQSDKVSSPFIILSNPNQRDQAEKLFLQYEFFRGLESVTRMDFAQNMQTYFVYTTQGAEGFSSSRARTLSEIEIRSILKTFFMDKPKIEPNEEFENFLRWFNLTVDKLKAPAFNRFFLDGFIIVSIQNEDIETILKTQPKGTFIIKCRTSDPGQLGFIYKATDTTFSKRPLIEYKVSVKSLANSILLTPDLTLVGKLDPASYQFSVLSKKEAFSPYMDRTVPYDVIAGPSIPACYSGYPVVASDIVFEKDTDMSAVAAVAAATSAAAFSAVVSTATTAAASSTGDASGATTIGVPTHTASDDATQHQQSF